MSVSADPPWSLTLFHTAHCHLCEQAEALLAPLLNPVMFRLALCDIVDTPALLERYGTAIPVLRDEAFGTELHWPFMLEDVMRFLTESRPGY